MFLLVILYFVTPYILLEMVARHLYGDMHACMHKYLMKQKSLVQDLLLLTIGQLRPSRKLSQNCLMEQEER